MSSDRNSLYPIFLKADKLKILIVGGGNTALEKVTFLIKSSPDAQLEIITEKVLPEIRKIIGKYSNITLRTKSVETNDLYNKDLIILATNNHNLNKELRLHSKKLGILTNVADTPELCDFYLGSIVTKGNIKIAISTNGKSPTLAKRLREILEDIIPDETDLLAKNLNLIRNKLKGNLSDKIKKLNQLTVNLILNEQRN